MAQQNINQYVYNKLKLNFAHEISDMSLTSDEKDYNEEVVFSPYLIAQGYGNRLPVYYDINNLETTQELNLTYKNYDNRNLLVSETYYNEENLDLSCFTAQTICDIGLVGMDNGLVDKIVGPTITYTNGLFDDLLKFQRTYFDRRMKMFQVTGYTSQYNRFSGITKTTLYEVEGKIEPSVGKYHELYGGFYQGFYKLFGYDYEILPERVPKGWAVEMVVRPRLIDQYTPGPNETTLNELYPDNAGTVFYLGTRAENKFYHHADGTPNCFTGYTRVTTPLRDCWVTCACCNTGVTNSRCIFVYPPRSQDGIHDPHVNYGCHVCGQQITSCGCGCNELPCDKCGWECKSHPCYFTTGYTPTPLPVVPLICPPCEPTPTPTPTPTSSPIYCIPEPVCTPTCTTCNDCECEDCHPCSMSGWTSIEDTCEKDPKLDALSNALSVRFSGDPKNPKICIRSLRITGSCETTGTCETTGFTYTTGHTIDNYCSPKGIYDYCLDRCSEFFDIPKWLLLDIVWRRYTFFDKCDLRYFGGLGDITEIKYLDSLANDTVKLISPPITHCSLDPKEIEIVKLNQKWLDDVVYRQGSLKIYVNGKIFFTVEDFEEIIPRPLDTDKERQVGVPFNMSWGGGTQGLRENLILSACTLPYTDYIQDPELFPKNVLSGTSLSGLNTNIVLEQNFGGTFDGALSQFRFYVSPLTAPEIKHNFKILKDRFSMFNPDCPDCNPLVCEPNDFQFNTQSPTPTPTITATITPTVTVTPTQTPSSTFPLPTPTTTPTPTVSSTFPLPTPTTTPTPTPSSSSLPLPEVDCEDGMDVVFVVDYTGSMGPAINAIKTNIATIVNNIITNSNNNYRLGLVIFDETDDFPNYLTYVSSVEYTSLPASQKYVYQNIGPNRAQVITAMEVMTPNNQSSFSVQLNKLNNPLFGFFLGNGIGGPEPSDVAIDRIINFGIAGSFLPTHKKIIILITDNEPSGNNDNYILGLDDLVIQQLTSNCISQNITMNLIIPPASTFASSTYPAGITALINMSIATGGSVVSTPFGNTFNASGIVTALDENCVTTMNLCTDPCNLGLSGYNLNTVGQLTCGNLTGTCGNIQAYTIFWYDSSGNIALKSGFGTPFPFVGPYNYNHPMTGLNSPMLPPGLYTPVLQAVTIAGTTYTPTGISGTTQAMMDCFTSQEVNIQSFNCTNGTLTGAYEHRVQYSTFPGSAVPPGNMYAHFDIDPSKKYIPYAFQGQLVPDTLKITFIGSNYGNVPIVVEYITVGGVLQCPNNFPPNLNKNIDYRVTSLPKKYVFLSTFQASNNYFMKVINLSNFVINNGDYLIIEVIPNQTQNQTSWDLYFTCLEQFECDSCIQQFYSYPYGQEIILSTITSNPSFTCNLLDVDLTVTGCSANILANEDIFKYFHPEFPGLSNPYLNASNQGGTTCSCTATENSRMDTFTPTLYSPISPLGPLGGNCTTVNSGVTTTCTSNIPNTVNVTKVNNVITITCSSQTDRDAFYNSYLSRMTNIGWLPTAPLPTSVDYYKVIIFDHYQPLNINSNCADNQFTLKSWSFHPSSLVTTTNSPGNFQMIINMNLITNNYGGNDPLCSACSGTVTTFIANNVNPSYYADINYSSISNTALRSIDPFVRVRGIGRTVGSMSYRIDGGTWAVPWYSNITYPYSGNPLTIIPSLSATTCDWTGSDGFFVDCSSNSWPTSLGCMASSWIPRKFPSTFPNGLLPLCPGPDGQNPEYIQPYCYTGYIIRRTDVNDPRSFDIEVGGNGTVIYRQVGANPPIILDPNYFV